MIGLNFLVVPIKDRSKYLLGLFLFAIALEGRVRFNTILHQGGAELAIAPYDIPLIFILLLWFLKILTNYTYRSVLKKYDFVLFLIPIGYAFSIINSKAIFFSLYEIARIIKMILVVLFLRDYVNTRQKIQFIFYSLVIVIFFQFIFAFMQSILGTTYGLNFFQRGAEARMVNIGSFMRAEGTLGHCNTLAQYLNMVLFPMLSFFAIEKKIGNKLWLIIGICLTIVMLFLTFSRSGWTSFIIGIAIYLLFKPKMSYGKSRKSFKYAVSFLFCGILIISFIFRQNIIDRFTTASEISTDQRIDLLVVAANMVTKHPFIGIGLNNFTEVIHMYDDTGISKIFPAPVHNIYLLILAETGIIGLAYTLFCLTLLLLYFIRLIKKSDEYTSLIALGIFSGFCSVLVNGLIVWGLRGDPLMAMFFLYIGIGLSLGRMALSKRETGL